MIDINKKYQTRDGRAVRIYAVDGGPLQILIHGAVLEKGCWSITSWGSDGEWSKDHKGWDLIEDRPHHKRTLWINMYEIVGTQTSHHSREQADDERDPVGCLACIKVELDFEEGEGL
jgi:hypothetical protein